MIIYLRTLSQTSSFPTHVQILPIDVHVTVDLYQICFVKNHLYSSAPPDILTLTISFNSLNLHIVIIDSLLKNIKKDK